MTDVDDVLRRDGDHWRATATHVPQVDWAAVSRRRRRTFGSPLLMIVATAATAAVVVVLAILVPSMVGDGSPKPLPAPAHQPSPSPAPKSLGGPASFIALNAAGVTQVDARTSTTRGMSTTESGRHPTALAVTDDGNVGYATYSEPGCRVGIDRYRWTSDHTSETTRAATVPGAKADEIAVSPDGHLLALSVVPCTKPQHAVRAADVDDLVVVDLDAQLQDRWTGYDDVSGLGALQWGPDNRTLSYIVNPCCGGGTEGPRLLDTTAPGTSYVKPKTLAVDTSIGNGIVLWYDGRLAVVMGSEIFAMSRSGQLGAVLASGLPDDVVTVDTDSTGRHLLVTTRDNRLLRWDEGVLTPLPGDWVDAGW